VNEEVEGFSFKEKFRISPAELIVSPYIPSEYSPIDEESLFYNNNEFKVEWAEDGTPVSIELNGKKLEVKSGFKKVEIPSEFKKQLRIDFSSFPPRIFYGTESGYGSNIVRTLARSLASNIYASSIEAGNVEKKLAGSIVREQGIDNESFQDVPNIEKYHLSASFLAYIKEKLGDDKVIRFLELLNKNEGSNKKKEKRFNKKILREAWKQAVTEVEKYFDILGRQRIIAEEYVIEIPQENLEFFLLKIGSNEQNNTKKWETILQTARAVIEIQEKYQTPKTKKRQFVVYEIYDLVRSSSNLLSLRSSLEDWMEAGGLSSKNNILVLPVCGLRRTDEGKELVSVNTNYLLEVIRHEIAHCLEPKGPKTSSAGEAFAVLCATSRTKDKTEFEIIVSNLIEKKYISETTLDKLQRLFCPEKRNLMEIISTLGSEIMGFDAKEFIEEYLMLMNSRLRGGN
jgi:hypothetical protein